MIEYSLQHFEYYTRMRKPNNRNIKCDECILVVNVQSDNDCQPIKLAISHSTYIICHVMEYTISNNRLKYAIILFSS